MDCFLVARQFIIKCVCVRVCTWLTISTHAPLDSTIPMCGYPSGWWQTNVWPHLSRTLNITIPDDAVDNLKCVRPKKVFPYHIWLPFDGKNSRYFEVSWKSYYHRHGLMRACNQIINWLTARPTKPFAFVFMDENSLNSPLFFFLVSFLFVFASQIIFVLNWLAGFTLVCCILPIDLLCMSFMRYIRFQFEVIKDDLVNGLIVHRHFEFHSIYYLSHFSAFHFQLNLRQNAESDLKRNNGNFQVNRIITTFMY